MADINENKKKASPIGTLINVQTFGECYGVSHNHCFVLNKLYNGQSKTESDWLAEIQAKHNDYLPEQHKLQK